MSINRGIDELWNIHAIKHYSEIKRISIYETTRMYLKIIMQSERIQTIAGRDKLVIWE